MQRCRGRHRKANPLKEQARRTYQKEKPLKSEDEGGGKPQCSMTDRRLRLLFQLIILFLLPVGYKEGKKCILFLKTSDRAKSAN